MNLILKIEKCIIVQIDSAIQILYIGTIFYILLLYIKVYKKIIEFSYGCLILSQNNAFITMKTLVYLFIHCLVVFSRVKFLLLLLPDVVKDYF